MGFSGTRIILFTQRFFFINEWGQFFILVILGKFFVRIIYRQFYFHNLLEIQVIFGIFQMNLLRVFVTQNPVFKFGWNIVRNYTIVWEWGGVPAYSLALAIILHRIYFKKVTAFATELHSVWLSWIEFFELTKTHIACGSRFLFVWNTFIQTLVTLKGA